MKVSDFHYELPEELIAQHPLPGRSDSRLLHLARGTGEVVDRQFRDLPGLLKPGDLLVFNDTRVIPARLFANKETGGRAEILIERLVTPDEALAQVRASKSPRPGSELVLNAAERRDRIEVLGRDGHFFRLKLRSGDFAGLLDSFGHVPLPPYIARADEREDRERYQTVYARKPGAVAAPTAGLHFDKSVLRQLDDAEVGRGYVTLHVGAGTFQPVRVETVEEHEMHPEYVVVPPELCETCRVTRAQGRRVIAVGTTVVRSLESAARSGKLQPYTGETRIFIYPGYEFRAVDGMITNFHLPESTLLMLVSAFAGLEPIKSAYQHAIEARYRFFSYGDAMLIL